MPAAVFEPVISAGERRQTARPPGLVGVKFIFINSYLNTIIITQLDNTGAITAVLVSPSPISNYLNFL